MTASSVSAPLSEHPMAEFFALRMGALWAFFKKEHISFWAACGYLFVEYVRPQSIVPALDVLPWGKLFIALAIVSWVADKKRRWTRNPLNKWIFIYLLIVILATFTAYWPEISRANFINYFGWFLAYFIIVTIVNSEKRLFIFLLIFLFASFKMSLFGARTWAMRGFSFTEWGLMGPEGPFQNSGEFAVQMLMMLPISYRFAIAMRPWLSRLKFWILMAMPATASMSVLGASSRGSQIGMTFQVYHTFLKGRLSFKVTIAVILMGFATYKLLPEEQLERFRTIGDDRPSQQRLLYWKRGREIIADHPILGVGYFNFIPYFERHYPHEVLYGRAQLPHNIFLQIGTDAGVIGLFCYGMLIIGSFRATRAIRRRLEHDKSHWLYSLSYGYDASFIGFLIAGQFVSIAYYPFMWINIAFVAATRSVVDNLAGGPTPTPTRKAVARA